MKKDRLEQFVTENRDRFDDQEPAPALWNTIENELGSNDSKSRSINIRKIVWRAAAVLIIFFAAWTANDLYDNYQNKQLASSGHNQEVPEQDSQIAELLEAEMYYTSQINERQQELFKYTSNNPAIREEINIEITELDSIYVELKHDLQDNLDNEEVIEAMIQNYRVKLQILEDVLFAIKETDNKEEKPTTHEI